MLKLLAFLLGVPVGAENRAAVSADMVGQRGREDAISFLRDGASHNTAKSGALLGVQGIFVVVDIFALEHGRPERVILASVLLLLAGSLIVMTSLRGTLGPTGARPAPSRPMRCRPSSCSSSCARRGSTSRYS